MSKINRKWEDLPEEKRKKIVDEVIYYFQSERDDEIGVIAAEQIIQFFIQTAGSQIYNMGIQDAQEAIDKKMEDLKLDLDMLME